MNMQAIGKRISALRKERDMTQVDLADRLGVTYQAVSSWERGNSMPDIAKLPDISQILNVSIDELLGDEKTAVIVKNVLTGQGTPTDLEGLADVAPILKPSQVKTMAKRFSGTKIDADILESIAPHMESEDLRDILLGCENIDCYMVSAVAPHMESEDLREVFTRYKEIDVYILNEIAPYLESEDLKDILLSCEDVDSYMISSIAPHMESEDLKEVILSLNKQ